MQKFIILAFPDYFFVKVQINHLEKCPQVYNLVFALYQDCYLEYLLFSVSFQALSLSFPSQDFL